MRALPAFAALLLSITGAFAGDAEIRAAQDVVGQQLRAFQSGDDARAYSFAAPTIKRIFPTLESFMGMVKNGYSPVAKPQSFEFSRAEERADGQIALEVKIVGPDGKDYRALYTLERQPDGTFKITGVSLRSDNTLST